MSLLTPKSTSLKEMAAPLTEVQQGSMNLVILKREFEAILKKLDSPKMKQLFVARPKKADKLRNANGQGGTKFVDGLVYDYVKRYNKSEIKRINKALDKFLAEVEGMMKAQEAEAQSKSQG